MGAAPASHGVAADLKVAARLFRLAATYRVHLGLLLFLNLVSVPLLLLLPLPLKIVVDNVIGSKALPDIVAPILPSDTSRAGLLVSRVRTTRPDHLPAEG